MNTAPTLLLSAALVLAAGPALADEATARKNNCTACHDLHDEKMGPSFKDIARAYRGKPKVVPALAKKVREGGQGVWGAMPMPPQSGVSDADLNKILNWILAQ